MEFTLHSLLIGATIFWLSCVNGLILQPGYNYYDQPQVIQPYFYNPTLSRQTVRIVTSDPNLLQALQRMDTQELQNVVYQKLFPYLEERGIPPGTILNVEIHSSNNQPRTVGAETMVGSFNPLPLPSIRPPAITNIRPSTLITPGLFGLNTLHIGGMGSLKPSLLGRESDYYQVGRPQTRSIDNACITESIARTRPGGDDPATSSLKISAQDVDLHQINVRDNDKNQGRWTEDNFKDAEDQDINELTNKFVKVLQGEIIHLLRDSLKNSTNNSNFSIDSTQLNKILKTHLGIYRNQTFNPTRPINPYSEGIFNNAWNPRNGDPNSQNPNSWWTNSNNYPNNGRTGNNNFNYPAMNNAQFGNPYNFQPMNNRQPENPSYSNPTMFNNGQLTNPTYNNPPMNMNGQPGNPNYSSPGMNSGRPGNAASNYPPINNRQPGNSTQNLKPMNNTRLPVNPNYIAPNQNSARPGFMYPNLQPSANSGRPYFPNTYAQNNPNSGINSPPYNNYGTSSNIPSQTPLVYPVNAGFQSGANPITVPQAQNLNVGYSQGQLTMNGDPSPIYEYRMPVGNYMQNPQIYNPYAVYTR